MPSKGSRIVPLRINDSLVDAIDQAIKSANLTRVDEPYDRSSWIRAAIRERLAKLERSKTSWQRKSRKGKGKVKPSE